MLGTIIYTTFVLKNQLFSAESTGYLDNRVEKFLERQGEGEGILPCFKKSKKKSLTSCPVRDLQKKLAATYSPTRSPMQYHRR